MTTTIIEAHPCYCQLCGCMTLILQVQACLDTIHGNREHTNNTLNDLHTTKVRPLFCSNVLDPPKLRGRWAVLTAPPSLPLFKLNVLMRVREYKIHTW